MAPPLPRRLGLVALFGLGLALIGGCGGSTEGEVSGLVTLDGKPLDNGYVTFVPADGKGQPAGGEIGTDGRYTARKVSLGEMKVEIRSSKGTGKKKKLYNTPDSPQMEEQVDILPPKYHSQTTLKHTVTAGSQEKNWELTSGK